MVRVLGEYSRFLVVYFLMSGSSDYLPSHFRVEVPYPPVGA